jgi:hypothetical protein
VTLYFLFGVILGWAFGFALGRISADQKTRERQEAHDMWQELVAEEKRQVWTKYP